MMSRRATQDREVGRSEAEPESKSSFTESQLKDIEYLVKRERRVLDALEKH